MKVAIFTLTKDRLEYTQRTFKGLMEKAGMKFDHFVVDNGSKDGTVKWLKKQKLKGLKLNPCNMGTAIASNQALEMIGEGYDYIGKVDNDCESITDEWLKILVDIMEKMGRQCVLSPMVLGLDNPPKINTNNTMIVNGKKVYLTKHVGGIACISSGSIYRNFRWDENLALRGLKDTEFCTYAAKNGCLIGYVDNVFIEHMDTTQGQAKKYPEYFKLARYERTHSYKQMMEELE